MTAAWQAIGWGLFFAWLFLHQPKPDTSMLDLKHCYAPTSVTYWDGPDGTRTTRSQYRSHVYCWPKHGVFMNANGALAWQSDGLR